jgi:type II secretory pathway pseudopilin PulG
METLIVLGMIGIPAAILLIYSFTDRGKRWLTKE